MFLLLAITAALGRSVAYAAAEEREGHTVAVIGAGVAGSFVAKWLDEAPTSFVVDVFEAEGTPGGRVKSDIDLGVELGASIAYAGNQYVASYSSLLGLEKVKPAEDNPAGTFGIWGGGHWKFKQASGPSYLPSFVKGLYKNAQIYWNYRDVLSSLFAHVNQAASSLDDLYSLLNGGEWYKTPEDAWKAIDLDRYLNVSFSQFYRSEVSSTSTRLLTELSTAVNRVNYNHATSELPALVGLVSHVPLVSGDLFALKEGNSALPRALIDSTSATLYLNTRVSLVVFNPTTKTFTLYNGDGKRLGVKGGYAKVVLATPWIQSRGIEFKIPSNVDPSVLLPMYFDNGGNFDDVDDVKTLTMTPFETENTETPYMQTVTTFVKSRAGVNGDLFGEEGESSLPTSIYFAYDDETELYGDYDIFSITLIRNGLYKVFSARPLPEEELVRVFGEGAEAAASQVWGSTERGVGGGSGVFPGGAYPNFAPALKAKPPSTAFKIFKEGIFYPTAFETTGSAMELAAIGAKNVANMIIFEVAEGEKKRNKSGSASRGKVDEL